MLTPSPQIIQLLAIFAPLFSAPTFQKAQVLLYATILAPGKRTVTAALTVLGLEQHGNFGKYHRVLNRSAWSPMRASRLLLWMLLTHFVPPGVRLVVLVDETLERRQGKQIGYKGWFRDAVRSTGNKVATSLGIRWLVLCLLVAVPWSCRPWALPFLVVPVLCEKTCRKLHKPHRSSVEWTARLLHKLVAWLPESRITLVGDGGFAAVALVACCQRLGVVFVCRMRLDAKLYEAPAPQPPSKRGPKPKKGARQPSLAARLSDPDTPWQSATVGWYGGHDKDVDYVMGRALWYTEGYDPVPIRWVLVRYEETNARTGKVTLRFGAFLCSDVTDPSLTVQTILGWLVARWNIEVTFEEMRACLGFETQRQWAVRAIGRTTPCLFGVFSLVVLMGKQLHPTRLPVQASDWYRKEEASFRDVLGAVRAHLWSAMNYPGSDKAGPTCLIPAALWRQVQQVLAYAA